MRFCSSAKELINGIKSSKLDQYQEYEEMYLALDYNMDVLYSIMVPYLPVRVCQGSHHHHRYHTQ